ncbi:MAG: TonB-dependent receptor [Balneola sp.]|nr:MAG: TonB-dependent receptor [Balneola sp.]
MIRIVKFYKNFFLRNFLFLLISIPVLGQDSSIEGVILSKDDRAPIPNANITLSIDKGTISDLKGEFEFVNLEPGTYTVNVSSIGFEDYNTTIEAPGIKPLRILLVPKVYKSDVAVITATRTEKSLADVTVPVTVIGKEEIERTGSIRLSDILDEQIGMSIVNDHGTGIQVQGFDPDYTLIMIDNQPVIGRTAGTLDLTRLAIGNVEQIEIVKGPSSALWGSDALAGVINIITEKGNAPLSAELTSRYGSNESYDGSGNIKFKSEKLSGNLFGNYTRSSGFDLDNTTVTPTIPQYDNITLMGGVDYRLNETFNLGIDARFYEESQSYQTEVDNLLLNGDESQKDYSFSPGISANIGERFLIEANAFLSRFESETVLDEDESGDNFSLSTFDQTLNRFELKNSAFWNPKNVSVFGLGMNREDLVAEIYADVPFFDSYFLFGQHEWKPITEISLVGGFRFDSHSEYSSQLTPKFSALYKASDIVSVKASLGGGFKAPAFRQLFLNFTNSTVGYSVFGTSTVIEGVEDLQTRGEIQELFYDPVEFTDITPERSFSFNTGFDIKPAVGLKMTINAFRNNVRDLIETERIALKTNGQSVFSYINLNRIYTQGSEFQITYTPSFLEAFTFSMGYQYLDARRKITRTFDDVVNGEVVTITEQEYVSMFNRSKHTWNFKTFYRIQPWDVETSLRLRYRGEYGFADFNSNQLLDDNEYAEAHAIVNATIAKTFKDRYELMVGANNLLDYNHPLYLPSDPGTTFFVQLNINLY